MVMVRGHDPTSPLQNHEVFGARRGYVKDEINEEEETLLKVGLQDGTDDTKASRDYYCPAGFYCKLPSKGEI